METYKFRIFGDNSGKLDVEYDVGSPILFECIFHTNDNEPQKDLDSFTNLIFEAFNNPQRIGAPMSKGKIEKI